MHAFITRRFLLLIFVLFGVSVLIFGILMTFSPERRAAAFVTTPQQAKDIPKIVQQFGLDDPFYVQYVRWIREVAGGNQEMNEIDMPGVLSIQTGINAFVDWYRDYYQV